MEDNSLIEDVEYNNGKDEESPILIAQRYLNIFHQIHIFNAAKKEEFNDSLLGLNKKVKEAMSTIPGGRILLEHIKEIEENKGLSSSGIPNLSGKETPETALSVPSSQTSMVAGNITIDKNFATNLAVSLATAFKNNNLMPSGNMNELSSVLSKSFDAYANNMQHITENILSKSMQHFNKISQMQMQMQSQTRVETQTSHVETSSPTNTSNQQNTQNNVSNTTSINNINIDSSSFSELTSSIKENNNQRHEDLMLIIDALNKNFSHQTKQDDFPIKAITTSITDALKETSEHQIEAIKTFGEALTQAIISSQQSMVQQLSEVNKNDIIKIATLQTNVANTPEIQENTDSESNSFLKNVEEKIQETKNKITQNFASQNKNSETKKHSETLLDKINKGISKINNIKEEISIKKTSSDEEISTEEDINIDDLINNDNEELDNIFLSDDNLNSTTDSSPKNNISQAFVEEPVETPIEDNISQAFVEEPIETPIEDNISQAFVEEPIETPIEDNISQAFVEEPVETPIEDNISQSFVEEPVETPIEDNISQAFVEEPVETPIDDNISQDFVEEPVETPIEDNISQAFIEKPVEKPIKKEVNKPRKINSAQSKAYDEALLKIKNALNSDDQISLNDLEIQPISLNSDDDIISIDEENNIDKMLLDEDNTSFSSTENIEEASEEWEYVDEDGNPVSSDGSEEWEYVDEDGNPVSSDGSEEWEYVDEDGNPVSSDGSEEWEYVDEDGNPVSSDGSEEWEYVDEDGNPVSSDGSEEWEYVDEDGNPITVDEAGE